MNGVTRFTGNLEPFAQSDDDRSGDSDECRSVALNLRVGSFPCACDTDGGACDGGEETRQETRLRGFGGALGVRGRGLGGTRLGGSGLRTWPRG